MDEFVLCSSGTRAQINVEVDRTVVRVFVPKSAAESFDFSLVQSHVARLYDVVFFRFSFDPRNFSRKIVFCVKGTSFDALRFSHLLFSL